ncbi:hypothetical protein AWN76_009625 [Rhodothermaceae bacterium RA]|nr:hypothetical protein AWN76_009625 [Rhodothermaceae bacterium RA]
MSPSPTAPSPRFSTLIDLLRHRAHHEPDRLAYTFLPDGEVGAGDTAVSLTYGELDRQARAIAARLQAVEAAGERALLLYPSGLEYIAAFFGCLYAGVTAVPAYPPRKNRSLDRIDGIVSDARASLVLTTTPILSMIERHLAEHPDLGVAHEIPTDTLPLDHADDWVPPAVDADTLAFLQYTSGSTGSPKGVMVSHGNLLHNEAVMQRAFQTHAGSRVASWLPLYHDMGLIGMMLQPLYAGFPCVFTAPVAFLQKPIRWLRMIAEYRATISGGPDFAYDLCARKITPDQCEGLDLSSWEVAFNGSEPVRAETIERFTEAFAPYGFRREAFVPCYGLAEATLFVTGIPKDEPPRIEQVDADALARHEVVYGAAPAMRSLVSSGRLWDGVEVRIVNPDTRTLCAPGEVGEIWVSGGSVTRGYWQRPDETAETFEATLSGANGSPALRTGDLGFIQDGNLFVTGRLKDLIIIRGRNHYPQDIEATVARAHPALRPGAGAAFAITVDGEEHLAVVQEVRRSALRNLDVEAVIGAIRRAVSEEHELHAHTVVLLKTGSLPKTTSGKIQRRACHAALLAGTLHEVGRDAPAAEPADEPAPNGALDRTTLRALPPDERRPLIAYRLQQLVARALKLPLARVDRQQPLGALGLDSLDVVELKLAIENDLGVSLAVDEELNDLSIDRIARKLSAQFTPESTGNEPADEPPSGPVETDLFAKCDTDGGYFGTYRLQKDTYFTQPVLEGPIGPHMRFQGREVITWSINNYLGIAQDPHVHERARRAIEEHGPWSPMGSRLMTGNTERHMALERRLARYLRKEASIVWNYGYMGVMGTIASLVNGNDTVIIDSLSHACIVDGAMVAAAGKPFRVFRHNDLDSLESQLRAAHEKRRGGILVVTEGVFGMTGDLAPLPEICDLVERFGARLFVDDAHGFGIMGPTGAGTAEHLGVQDRLDLYFGTFAKSFAAIGGVTAGDERVVDYIRYNARTNIFAKSLPMVYIEAVDAALDLIENGEDRRARVWHIARRLQTGLAELGFDIGSTASPITPVYVPAGDEATTLRAIRMLRDELGIFASAVTYPVVPRGVMLFRLTSTAAHTDEDVDRTLEAFRILRDRLNLRHVTGDGSVGSVNLTGRAS